MLSKTSTKFLLIGIFLAVAGLSVFSIAATSADKGVINAVIVSSAASFDAPVGSNVEKREEDGKIPTIEAAATLLFSAGLISIGVVSRRFLRR